MEVSAHALYYRKTAGVRFSACIFTNLSQDHLDFFSDMENYIKTKLKFMSTKNKAKFLNVDDSSVHFLQDDLSFTYGIDHPADCFAMDISLQMGRSVYLLNLFDNVLKIDTKLSGKFNVYNVLLGASICSVLGIEAKTIVTAINNMQSVDGRFNVVSTEKGDIVIDFAHTPDGLENILCSLKQFNKKIICVFGCGGNRDSKKRPLMGAIAEKYCDEIYITSDNPRFENPDLIAEDILEGVKGKNKFTVENSRIKAINYAIRNMTPNSIVVICGKGGEKYQDINGIMYPFEDKQEVFKLLKQLNIKVIN